jgi:hypothetical protein
MKQPMPSAPMPRLMTYGGGTGAPHIRAQA